MSISIDNQNTSSKKGFVISHLNVRSLIKHMDESFLHLSDDDVICFSETWLSLKVDDPLVSRLGYKYIRLDRKTGKKGGGLMMYIKEPLFPYVEKLPNCITSDEMSEELWVILNKPGWKKTIIGLIYRPPSGKADLFIQHMGDMLGTINVDHNIANKDVIVIGDFNIDFAKTHNLLRTRLKGIMGDYGLQQTITCPTRVTNNSKSTIDLIFTNINTKLINSVGTIEVSISDHKPIYLNKKAQRHKHPKTCITSRNYRYYDKEIFGNVLLDNQDWHKFWAIEGDPEKSWEIMCNIISNSVDILYPRRKINIREDQHPWVNKNLRLELQAKDALYRRAQRTNAPEDWHSFHELKVKTRKAIIASKRAFINGKLDECKDDPRLFWKEMDKNLNIGKGKNTQTVCERIRDSHGNIVTGNAIAATFNDFYISIGKELALKFPDITNVDTPIALDIKKQCSFRFIGMKEMKSVIQGLKSNKSTCVSDINMKIFKDALITLLVEFTHLINVCLDKSKMPTQWKVGTVTPIPKGAPSLNMGDYRPISVLPAPSKVIERLVYNQLVYYLECNMLLDSRQHGFRKNHSTVSAILEVVQYLYERTDVGDTVHCAFIDYSKAFDTIDHEILCKKLYAIGFNRQIVCWCRNYLDSRCQSVKFGEQISPLLPISCGVPQGSILGPLFFIIYVNDLLKLFPYDGVKITLYADDTVLYISHQDPSKAASLLEEGLRRLSNWCVKNKMTINVKKTKHMILSPIVCGMKNVLLNGEILDIVHIYNYLGVKIDDKLSFEPFLREKCNKVNMRIYQLSKLRKYITINVASLIYKQTILPAIEYADQMVESGPSDKIDRLQVLQEKAVRIIDNKAHPEMDTTLLSNYYRIIPLKERRAEHLCVSMLRLSKDDRYLDNSRPKIHLRNRHKIRFKTFKRVHEKYLKSPISRGISMWDRIPESVQKSTTKVKFKRDLKQHMLELLRPRLK